MKKLFLLGLLVTVAPVTAWSATCSGGANCTACKNCSSCGHCGKRGGTCSRCRPDLYGASTSAAPVYRAPAYNPPANTQPRSSSPRNEPRRQRQSRRNVAVPASFSGKCVGVTDGDTITVLYNSTPVRIRLQGIDAPESRQSFGTQAKNGLSQMVFGKVVTVRSNGVDRYGRVLGWISAARKGGGTVNVNATMVSAGMAWWYRQYSPTLTELGQYQDEAKRAKRGLWRDANPVAPWSWRRGAR